MNERQPDGNRRRLDEIQQSYERFATRVWRSIATLAAVLVLSLAVQAWLIHENRVRANFSQHNSERIDSSLKRALLLVCTETNTRHDATVTALDLELAQIKGPDARARSNQAKASTIALINALAPKRADCDAYVRRLLAA